MITPFGLPGTYLRAIARDMGVPTGDAMHRRAQQALEDLEEGMSAPRSPARSRAVRQAFMHAHAAEMEQEKILLQAIHIAKRAWER